MRLILSFVLILLGVLAASSFIVSRQRQAGPLIQKLRPAQGWLGLIGCIMGCAFMVDFLLSMTGKNSPSFLALVRNLGGAGLLAATGFLMGFGMINELIADNTEAQQKADELYERLAAFQVPMGLASIGFGVWLLLAGTG
jgi:hypothetical protein